MDLDIVSRPNSLQQPNKLAIGKKVVWEKKLFDKYTLSKRTREKKKNKEITNNYVS